MAQFVQPPLYLFLSIASPLHVCPAAPRLCLHYSCKTASCCHLGSPLNHASHPLHNISDSQRIRMKCWLKKHNLLTSSVPEQCVTCSYFFDTEAFCGLKKCIGNFLFCCRARGMYVWMMVAVIHAFVSIRVIRLVGVSEAPSCPHIGIALLLAVVFLRKLEM